MGALPEPPEADAARLATVHGTPGAYRMKDVSHADIIATVSAGFARAEERHGQVMKMLDDGERRDEQIRLTIAAAVQRTEEIGRRLDKHVVDCHRIPKARAEERAAALAEQRASALALVDNPLARRVIVWGLVTLIGLAVGGEKAFRLFMSNLQ